MALPFPPNHTRFPWQFMSSLTICVTGLLGKAFLRLATRVQTKNWNGLLKHIWDRPPQTPLITFSNHTSCVDDVVLWSLLPLSMLASVRGQRWIPGAKEVIFTNPLFTYYFSRGKLVPVVRGDGVYQEGMDFLISKLNSGGWIHIFPEGKIIADHRYVRHKWGIGRLVAECARPPTVIPLWHVGMDDMLPNRSPYIPQLFQKLTVLVGDPIDLSGVISTTAVRNAVVMRRQITDMLENGLAKLKHEAEDLHRQWSCDSLRARRDL